MSPAEVNHCRIAHTRLLAFLDALPASQDPRGDSLLPGWTIGHVLSHLARNADALAEMSLAAARGEQRLMYPTAEAREDEINAGADRSLDALVDDVRISALALDQIWTELTDDGWRGNGITRIGLTPVATLPWRRWREIEVHQSDLGLGFSPLNWSADYVNQDLDRLIDDYRETPDRETREGEKPQNEASRAAWSPEVMSARPWQQVAWLLGRESGISLS